MIYIDTIDRETCILTTDLVTFNRLNLEKEILQLTDGLIDTPKEMEEVTLSHLMSDAEDTPDVKVFKNVISRTLTYAQDILDMQFDSGLEIQYTRYEYIDVVLIAISSNRSTVEILDDYSEGALLDVDGHLVDVTHSVTILDSFYDGNLDENDNRALLLESETFSDLEIGPIPTPYLELPDLDTPPYSVFSEIEKNRIRSIFAARNAQEYEELDGDTELMNQLSKIILMSSLFEGMDDEVVLEFLEELETILDEGEGEIGAVEDFANYIDTNDFIDGTLDDDELLESLDVAKDEFQKKTQNTIPTGVPTLATKMYSEGLSVKVKGLDQLVSLCNVLELGPNDMTSLYKNGNLYYLLIDKFSYMNSHFSTDVTNGEPIFTQNLNLLKVAEYPIEVQKEVMNVVDSYTALHEHIENLGYIVETPAYLIKEFANCVIQENAITDILTNFGD